MSEVIKNEFIDRYIFLYDNVDYILMPRIKNYPSGNVSLNVDKEFLDRLEMFMLSDIPYNKTNFYNNIMELKKDMSFVDKCKMIRSYLIRLRKVKYIDNYDVKMIFQVLRNYILGQNDNVYKENKLKALDEYFRFNRYNNSSMIIKGGAVLGYDDLGIYCERLRNPDKPYKNYKRSLLNNSNFIEYISDSNNHYENNNSIFTEDEKQDVYLKLHPDAIPWDKVGNKKIKRITD